MVKRLVACAVVAAAAFPIAAIAQESTRTAEEQMRARQRIAMMEAALQQAVNNGADSVIFQVRNVMGDQPILLSAPRVRGFRLDGYGVFFDVEVPSMTLPILWPVGNLVAETRAAGAMLAELRMMARELEDRDSRALLESKIAQLESQFQPVPGAERMRGTTVSAASVAPETARTLAAPAPAAPMPSAIEDPQEEYRKQVKAALVDAMLENSQTLSIAPDEWLIVGARRNVMRDPLFPGNTVDTTTWVARVKGSVLADLRAQRITPDDARKLVEQREQ